MDLIFNEYVSLMIFKDIEKSTRNYGFREAIRLGNIFSVREVSRLMFNMRACSVGISTYM